MDWLPYHRVYVRRKISECLQHTAAKPIRLLWIDPSNGDDVKVVWWFVSSVGREKMVVRSLQRSCPVRCHPRGDQDAWKLDGDSVEK